jgi:hypothetical protein
MAEITGGCVCGAVRFTTTAKPYRVGLCHCLTCRKHSGSAFNFFAIYPADQVEIRGETRAFASSALGRQHFCPACGSSVFGRDEGSDEIELHVGAFDEPGCLRPTYELWIGRREPWLPEMAGLAHYSENRQGSGRSEP